MLTEAIAEAKLDTNEGMVVIRDSLFIESSSFLSDIIFISTKHS